MCGALVVCRSLPSSCVTSVPVEFEAETQRGQRRVDARGNAVREQDRVLTFGFGESGTLEETKEASFDDRVRRTATATLKNLRHGADATSSSFTDRCVPIRHFVTARNIVALGAIERLLD